MPNLPLSNAIPDPSDIRGAINALTRRINLGVAGLFAATTAPVSTDTATTEEILQAITLPASFFTAPGQTLRLVASGTTAANGNTKTIKVKFGSIVLSSGALTISGKKWKAVLEVMHTDVNAQIWNGIYSDPTTGNVVDGAAATVIESAQISCVVTGQNGSASAGDITCNNFYAEIIK